MPARKFLKSEAASSTTEYALIIALVAAALMLSGEHLQFGLNLSFNQVAASLSSESMESDAAAGSSAVANSASAPEVASTLGAGTRVAQFLAWAGLCAAAGVICYSGYRRRRMKRLLEELHCGPEPVAEPTNPNFVKRQDIQRVLLRHFDESLDGRIEVKQVMSRRIHSVQPTAAVDDVTEIMEREGFHHLLVMKEGSLLGVISDRDLKKRRGWTARHIMTACPLTVSPRTQLNQAITMLLHQRISCLPVVEDGKVCGIMTATDMLMTLQCLIKLLERGEANGEMRPAPVPVEQALNDINSPVAAC